MNFIEIVNELNSYIPDSYFSTTDQMVFHYITDGYVDLILFADTVLFDSENDTNGTQDEIIETTIIRFNDWIEGLSTIKLPIVKAGYEIVRWPDIQQYMEEDWFQEEAILMNSEEEIEEFGVSAYWIPKERMKYPMSKEENLFK